MVDTPGLGPGGRKPVEVRALSPAPKEPSSDGSFVCLLTGDCD